MDFHINGPLSSTEAELQAFLACIKANLNIVHLHCFLDSKAAITLIKKVYKSNTQLVKMQNRVTLRAIREVLQNRKLIGFSDVCACPSFSLNHAETFASH